MPNFACDICDATFRRGEHLTRHKLLHFGDRPFNCSKCDRTFARRDTLQRHIAVHERSHAPSSRGSARRKVRRACRNCSQSKQKCDGTKPCVRCVSKSADCVYEMLQPISTNLENDPQDLTSPGHLVPNTITTQQEGFEDHNGTIFVEADTTAQSYSHSVQSESTTDSRTFDTVPLVTDDPTGMPLALFSDPTQYYESHLNAGIGLSDANEVYLNTNTNSSNFGLFGTDASDMAFWNDPRFAPMTYQDPYTDFDIMILSQNIQNVPMETSPFDSEMDQNPGSPPVPSFLDARSSPEPLEGQGLRFDDYIRKTFGNRRNLQGQISRNTGDSGNQLYKAHVPPLIGDFPSILSSEEDAAFWEPENLAHVEKLPRAVYDKIISRYRSLNITNGQYTEFASGDFPSLEACNAFMQLFFEEFNPLFPLLHQPSFDPTSTPWLLVLAVIATGCRFSRVPAAVSSGDLMQEFLRRAFFATIEEDYSSTCEPWLAQAGLLNLIGMAFSKDMRLTQSAQSMRSSLSSICRQVNCFRESQRSRLHPPKSCDEAWRLWIRQESMRRLAHLVWLVDSQYVLLFELPPLVPMNLLQLRLPCPERLWRAPTASAWLDESKTEGTYLPLTLRQELNKLYQTRACQPGLGDFATLLLVLGVFRNAMEIQRAFHEGFGLLPTAIQNDLQLNADLTSPSETFLTTRKAMDYLRILCSPYEESPGISSLKSAILHHYHMIGVLLSIPLGELFCYCGYRVTSADVTHCEMRLKVWAQQRGSEARRMALHASRLFGCIRHSNMHGYYEGRAMLVACQALWIYAAISGSSHKGSEEATEQAGQAPRTTIRLDQLLTKQAEESWLQNGDKMRPYLAGVGSITGVDGIARLIQEGSRIMCASSNWPLSNVLGRCLRIYYHLRTGKTLEELS